MEYLIFYILGSLLISFSYFAGRYMGYKKAEKDHFDAVMNGFNGPDNTKPLIWP